MSRPSNWTPSACASRRGHLWALRETLIAGDPVPPGPGRHDLRAILTPFGTLPEVIPATLGKRTKLPIIFRFSSAAGMTYIHAARRRFYCDIILLISSSSLSGMRRAGAGLSVDDGGAGAISSCSDALYVGGSLAAAGFSTGAEARLDMRAGEYPLWHRLQSLLASGSPALRDGPTLPTS